ncbi:MAG: carboxypeptidase regulatory-like domain-containing protein [Myxococcaceae bacterium]|nr:carboxypeptidase regulatory-like domain-containing protein [Myxococcaceae bacterium]
MTRVLLTAVVVLSGCGLSPLTSEDVRALTLQPEVVLSGVVRHAQSQGPLEGAVVAVQGSSSASAASGRYRIAGLTTGPARVTATLQGFAVAEAQVVLVPGANGLDLALAPLACSACGTGQVCDTSSGQCVTAATLTGGVVDDCTSVAIAARVTIDGRSTCSGNQKAYFRLEGLHPGGPQTLGAGAPGYRSFTGTMTLMAGFNVAADIRLVPLGGCDAATPPPTCSCTATGCQ